MDRKEILRRVRHIQISSRRAVNDVLAGQYASVFRGRGIEFDEVREYQPGDDIRSIDWNVTARMGRLFVRKYVEERELTVLFAVDASRSGLFGTRVRAKLDLAAELTGVLAFSAIHNHDKVGLVLFTDRVERFVRPNKGMRHGMRILLEIEATLASPTGRAGTDLAGALEFLRKVLTRRAVIFLISDFQAADFKRPLQIVSRRHDVVAVAVTDPRELDLPDLGLVRLRDLESGQELLLDTGDRATRERFARDAWIAAETRKRLLQSIGVDLLELRTDRPYMPELLRLFQMRERRR